MVVLTVVLLVVVAVVDGGVVLVVGDIELVVDDVELVVFGDDVESALVNVSAFAVVSLVDTGLFVV